MSFFSGVWLASAQEMPPLNAPLIALNTVEQDHILLYDWQMNATRTVTLGDAIQRVWDFSADGCRLVATLDGQLVSADLWGNTVRPLLTVNDLPPDTWEVFEPTLSPDGTTIAFTWIQFKTDRNGETQRESYIATVPFNGGTPTLLSQSGQEYSPRWSPDGQWLAYVSYEERVAGNDIFATAAPTVPPPAGVTPEPPNLLNEADLWVVSADGKTKYPLTTFATGNVSMPRWSPDGTLISFVYSPSGNNDMFWMIANSQGAIPTQLSFDWVTILDTTWLTDGTAIIGSAMGLQNVAQNRLWRIPLVGRADTDATPYLPDNDLPNGDYPRFSPDGRYLATRTAYALAIVDLQTNQQTLLNEPWALGNTPAIWSPSAFVGESACN